MQIGWIVNIMTVITPSCREIRAMSWNWSKSSYCRNHLKVNLRLISYEYRPQLYCIEGITFHRLFKLSRRKLSVLAPPVLHQYFAVLFLLHHHLSLRSSDAKRPFQHQTLKVELSSDTRSYFFVANRLSSYERGILRFYLVNLKHTIKDNRKLWRINMT